jgi:glycosyltransferase involved in cell wall biosynthesis
MRVLYYHQHFSTPQGATGTRSYEMARRLVERGHQVTLVCGTSEIGESGLEGDFVHGRRTGAVDGIEVIEFNLPYDNRDSFPKRVLTFLRYAFRSSRIAMTRKYDLIFASSTPLTAGIPGILASIFRRKPFVFEVRDLWPELPQAMGVITNPLILKGMDVLEWLSYHCARRCIGLSPGIVEGIVRRGIPRGNVALVPNGCDLELFHPEKGEAKRPPETGDGDFVAVFSGTHGIANGLDALLDAAAELKNRGRTDIKLVMVGNGKLKRALQERAEREGLNNCIFLTPIPKPELTGLQRGVDAGLMLLANVPAFYYGTSPNKFFDYISSGLPVLNNYPGWLAEMIDRNECGIAVPPENSAAFADALESMADNRSKLQVMGKNARRLAEQEFDRRKLADEFVDCLEGALGGAPELQAQEKSVL